MNTPRVLVLVHGGPESIEAVRARGLTQAYPADLVRVVTRSKSRRVTAREWTLEIQAWRPELLYVINAALPGSLLACWFRVRHRLPFVLDTGDVVYAMARSAGTAPPWRLPCLWLVEAATQRTADTVVVRGTFHRDYLLAQGRRKVALIRDGVESFSAPPAGEVEALRKRLGLGHELVVGLMGSLVYSPRLQICYGWDLVQALAELRALPVRGLIIGDGPGKTWLAEQARQLGVADRLTFTGRIAYAQVPLYLRLLDVALSTQTNNLAGRVRTTGKLPEYMAAERFILASAVGEATLLLPQTMLLDYAGEVDAAYPHRLAERIRALQANPDLLAPRHTLSDLAKEHCSYSALSRQFNEVVANVRLLPDPRKPATPGK